MSDVLFCCPSRLTVYVVQNDNAVCILLYSRPTISNTFEIHFALMLLKNVTMVIRLYKTLTDFRSKGQIG